MKTFELGQEALAFIKEKLSNGDMLSKLLLDLPLHEGSITTELPETMTAAEILDFEEPLEVYSMSRDYILPIVMDYLRPVEGTTRRYAICETLRERDISSPWFTNVIPPFFTSDSEPNVYLYAAGDSNTREIIVNMITEVSLVYRSTFILTQVNNIQLTPGQVVDAETLRRFVEGTQMLFVLAYDDDGVLTWTPRH